jgi:hypothetical protein
LIPRLVGTTGEYFLTKYGFLYLVGYYVLIQGVWRALPMRKRVVSERTNVTPTEDQEWMDLEDLAEVEVTSEDPAHPVETALIPGGAGWRAAEPGRQTVRVLFDQPQKISRVRLSFQEPEQSRTQEFVLRWSPDGGRSYREIVRQQYNFSPPDSARELEDYTVRLDGATVLELIVIPDISGGPARATLTELRLG